ncbi:hypothetical protein [Pseudomonas tolaasii]|uniref:hypothetical protein n=1 Tax=Pseudomonas tolaasii TaxID=29442 RepID=UPI0004CFD1F3|nr:hypothetical protein [Pseudomonas tolaasii]MBW1249555.1 hypothetical protein [Pseudomonas tolaasii]NWC43545.1 hypothetical protein [Pseudomonas tolaasii]
MKIESAIHGQRMIMGAPEARLAVPAVVHPSCDDQSLQPGTPARRPAVLRGALSSLRYQALQNPPVARADTTPPGPTTSDSQLAGELAKHFGELHAFLKGGRLTPSSLRQVAAQALTGE